jgi:hydrogenase 3 maturation protease
VISRKRGIQDDLREWLVGARKVVVVGIGNPIRSDDFVGVKVVQDLQGKTSRNVYLIESETVPESFTQEILDFNATHVLLIDASILGLKPGESDLVDPSQLNHSPAFSTHVLPLRIFCEYIAKAGKAKIGLVLIEPKKTDFGEGLTPEVDDAAKTITNVLLNTLP